MNQVIDKTLRFINLWSKIEIIAALVLTVIILGYAVCPNRSQKSKPIFRNYPINNTTIKPVGHNIIMPTR
ncbi:hypothetical protein [Crocosphaera watsonii]|uniref:Uncharacterized protein n=1 Tax=Crocosphaera watsonii WH 0401 TaxID=555881 RepID=T2JH25_CROWT|nr:hypothetical protein [Crocosphaera watsonii]CCQ64401.1 hypothetical protein CWATWH0401_2452 [Crocosphaera watsonii WH 0401]